MFYPRLITFLVFLGCSVLAVSAFNDLLFPIPSEKIRMVVTGACALFALSALVVLVGFSDAQKGEAGILIGNTWRGKMLRKILSPGGNGYNSNKNIHCCDVYISTTALLVYLILLLMALGTIVFISFSEPIVILVSIIGTGLVGLFIHLGNSENSLLSKAFKRLDKFTFSDKVNKVLVAVIIFCAVGGSLVLAYLPVSQLMLLGYSLLASIGITVATLNMFLLPLYCIAGKKLLSKTRFSEKICPLVIR